MKPTVFRVLRYRDFPTGPITIEWDLSKMDFSVDPPFKKGDLVRKPHGKRVAMVLNDGKYYYDYIHVRWLHNKRTQWLLPRDLVPASVIDGISEIETD
jgi:hypothetical protein